LIPRREKTSGVIPGTRLRNRCRGHGLLLLLAVLTAACAGEPGTPNPPAGPSGPGTPSACIPVPGAQCFGAGNYVEYNAGDLPIVVSVPHGGTMAPGTIPDRTSGTTVTDTNTIELGRAVAAAFQSATGRRIHLVICHLRRTKLDANREVVEAAQGNAEAVRAWTEYHGFVELATSDVVRRDARGLYIDLHGHGHAIARLELGYLLSSGDLSLTDAELNSSGVAASSSLSRALAFSRDSFSEVLRGSTSLGGLLAATPSVPSPSAPSPGSDPYFTGGYSTERHTTTLPGVQIESHFAGVRDSAGSRAAFAQQLVAAVRAFTERHLGLAF
jgi:hypothetical protein